MHPITRNLLLSAMIAACLVGCAAGAPGSTASPTSPSTLEGADQTPFALPSTLATSPVTSGATAEPDADQNMEEARQAATATSQAEATASALPLYNRVLNLQASGLLTRSGGEYHSLPDFEGTWARINYYDWSPTGYAPQDFVLRANLSWESASGIANFWNSGCGFVYRLNARGDHYLAFLGLDGWINLYRNLDGIISSLGRWYYGEVGTTQGEASIEFVVEGEWMTFFVNGQQVHRLQDDLFSSGLLGYALASGTNQDYGTKCRATDVELWQLRSP